MRTTEQRFFEKTAITESGCIVWTAAIGRDGYGLFWFISMMERAHRWSYRWANGPDSIPPGLHLDHLCRNRACVAPAHLEPVTMQENIRRGEAGINNAVKTHCPYGHPYAGDNLYVGRQGKRECRTCMRKRGQERRQKSPAALLGDECNAR